MKLRKLCVLAVVAGAIVIVPAPGQLVIASSGQRSSPHKWWQADRFKAELGLSEAQTSRLEAVFQEHLPRLREFKKALDREEEALSALLQQGTDEEAVMAAQIDRVESAKGELGKLRTLMLFRMRRLLSAEQRTSLDELHRRYEEERRRARSSGAGDRQ